MLRQALAAIERTRPAGHVDTLYPVISLAAAERALGDLPEALALATRAQRGLGRLPQQSARANATREVGLTLRAMGRHAEANEALQQSYEIYRTVFGEAHPSTKAALERLQAPR